MTSLWVGELVVGVGVVGMAKGSFGVGSVVVQLLEIVVAAECNLKESVVAVLEGTAGKYPDDIAAASLIKV